MSGGIIRPDGTTGEVHVNDAFVLDVCAKACEVQGAFNGRETLAKLSPERRTAMLHGTANVLRALTALGWVLVPPHGGA